jgi:hypothetical protein
VVSVTDREQRIVESRAKIHPLFRLDADLCLYSPQDNVDSLQNPRIRDWFDFIGQRYRPDLPTGKRHILLMMPCTKTKPYPLSLEHLRINAALFAAGFRPVSRSNVPQELIDAVPAEFSRDSLNLAPLRDDNGTVIHRAVISEPLAFVPYEHIMHYEDRESPAIAYDDPGLFENRGNAVSPWRSDFTGQPMSKTRWQWGPSERRAYVAMHNAMSAKLSEVIQRFADTYDRRIAWVAPGLTHRSFVIAADERRANRVNATRTVAGERLKLVGANDLLSGDLRIECLPTIEQCDDARVRLARRLGRDVSRVGGEYSRGGGGATPLALPELLEVLVAALEPDRRQAA